MKRSEIQKRLAKELKLRDYYEIRNHVAALALSDDIYKSIMGKGLYLALKEKPGVFADVR